MREELAIEATGLEKSYGELRVLDGVDLRVARGTVYALLGPNGAGKTTMVRILSTLLRPDAGTARVAGFDVLAERSAVRRAISLTGQHVAVDALATGAENLRTMGRLRGLSRGVARRRADELLERFALVEAGARRAGTYSGGMLRRLDLAAGLVAQPSVLFLDEPTTGLDPRSRQATWDVIGELVAADVTVLLTTQYLEEADQIADRIGVIDGGRVIAEGTADELKRRVAGQRLELTFFDGATASVATDGSAAHVRALLDELDPNRDVVERFAVHGATLDDVFLTLTGHPTAETQKETVRA